MFLILFVIIFCFLVAVMISGLSAAVWVPAFSKDTDAAIKYLKLKAGMTVMEFGCGDGRFLRKAARSGAKAIGYEINPFLAVFGRIMSIGKGVEIHTADAWKKSFKEADVVFAFIMPQFMKKLGTKLKSELKPGTVIVTYAYPIPGLKPTRHQNNCYFYSVKSN